MDRRGWPEWAVERVECCNCGRMAYHGTPAPSKHSPEFLAWVTDLWAWGSAMQTKLGFMVWCSNQCRRVWEETRAKMVEDGWLHEWQINMEQRAAKSGRF